MTLTMEKMLRPEASGKQRFLADLQKPPSHQHQRTPSQEFAGKSPSSATSVTSHSTEEDLPMKRAVRMVVGLSQSSLQEGFASPNDSNGDPVKPLERPPSSSRLEESLHLPPRQESDGTASTARSSDHDLSLSSSLGEGRDSPLHKEGAATTKRPSAVDHGEDDGDDDDFSDGFSIQKLYGREHQEAQLFEMYDYIMGQRAPRRELQYVLISGGVGTGKTSLADSLRRRVQCEGGYFCVGTFDQWHQRGPVAPLVDAFADYVQQVLDKGEEEVEIARSRIRTMVDSADFPNMMRIVPSLRDLMGEASRPDGDEHVGADESYYASGWGVNNNKNDDTTPEKTGSCHFAMVKLMRAISRPERPVVWMLDDLQWAGDCPFAVLQGMVQDDMNDSLMFLGITRSDVGPDSGVSGFLRRIEDEGVRISNVALSTLALEDVQDMVEDSFLMPQEQLSSLSTFMYEASSGNPFLVAASIQTVKNEPRFFHYDKGTNTWKVNPEDIDCYLDKCPIKFLTRKLDTYPRDEKKVLMVISCLGSHSTQGMIEAALQEDAVDSLNKLSKKGKLDYNDKDGTYTIKYNAVRSAAYNLIGTELQPAFHLEVGLRLMNHLDPQELDEHIFCVVSQLEHGLTLLQDQEVKYEVAALFVRAAEKASRSFSFKASHWALKCAYGLLGPDRWEEAYELSMVLYNYLAEIEFALDDNDRVDYLLDEIEKHGRSCCDKLRSFTTRVHVLGVRGQPDAAIDRGVKILSCLGVHLPTNPNRLKLIWAMLKTDRKVKGRSSEMLRRLPKMTENKQLACMQVLNLLFLHTFQHRVELFPFVVLKMMKMTLEYGSSAISSVAFAGYGSLLCTAGRNEEGQRFGKLALDLVDRFDTSAFRARVIAMVYGCIQPSTEAWAASLEPVKEGHRSGLMTGDFEFAMLNATLYVSFMLESGSFNFDEMKSELQGMIELTERHGHRQQMGILRPIMASLEIFADPNGDLVDPTGSFDDGLKECVESGNAFFMYIMYTTKAFFFMYAGEFEKGMEVIDALDKVCLMVDGSISDLGPLFLEGLFSFGAARRATSLIGRRNLIKRGKKAMKGVQKLAIQNPDNCMSKSMLLEAEYAALCKKSRLAKQKYRQAIAMATGTNVMYEIALGNQLAATHYSVDLNDPRSGIVHMEAAIDAFKDWGGNAAVTLMERKMREFKDSRRFSIQRLY